MAETGPLVSVVIAAYNRSNVVGFTIETVRRQTLADWELWVIGDACTDDTGEVVASFGDPRIRFFNLERNVGSQSGPNNEGIRRARGRYVAFLGQDDLWFPDHLELGVGMLEETGADFAFSLMDEVWPDGRRFLSGGTPDGRFHPWVRAAPSSWTVRRETLVEVGLWREAVERRTPPDDELLNRIHRAGKEMRLVPALTVVKLPALRRADVYAKRESHENEEWFRRLAEEPALRERELSALLLSYAGAQAVPKPLRLHLLRWAADLLKRISSASGHSAWALYHVLRHPTRGGRVRAHRRRRGLDPLERRGL